MIIWCVAVCVRVCVIQGRMIRCMIAPWLCADWLITQLLTFKLGPQASVSLVYSPALLPFSSSSSFLIAH